MSNKVIVDFWNWFMVNVLNFQSRIEKEEMLDDLEKKIEKLGNFGWEIGKVSSTNKEYFLVISGGGTELDQAAAQIISRAPKIEHWQFYNWKLAKEFSTHHIIYNDSFQDGLTIDIIHWKFILYRFDDSTYEIEIIVPSEFMLYEANLQQEIGEIILNNILGEEKRVKYILAIEFITDSPSPNIPHNIERLKTLFEQSVNHGLAEKNDEQNQRSTI